MANGWLASCSCMGEEQQQGAMAAIAQGAAAAIAQYLLPRVCKQLAVGYWWVSGLLTVGYLARFCLTGRARQQEE